MPTHTDALMVQGLHGRFEGQQEKQVVTDSESWLVETLDISIEYLVLW